ncbi:type I-E CRISPR-associated protein Cas7/Cse4/CasC [Edwardsiella anguillarum]|nr:type I-E CRISPR-associated protein Cas7/Cse4/CasC [Edwardsiella anguillarum]
MVAKAADMNVEAAASFSHAISTHKVANEVEFFTALDDRQDEPGSAHMGVWNLTPLPTTAISAWIWGNSPTPWVGMNSIKTS